MKLSRPKPLPLECWDGRIALVRPLTSEQYERICQLDADLEREQAEGREISPEQLRIKRGKQVAIVHEGAVIVDADGQLWRTGSEGERHDMTVAEHLAQLTCEEEIDILNAMICELHGLRPKDAVDAQQAMRELYKKKQNLAAPK